MRCVYNGAQRNAGGSVWFRRLSIGPTRKRARDALAHHREPIGLSGWWSVLCCLPLLQLRTIGSYQATVWRHLWWGLCRRERAQAPTLKEVHKEQVGLATHHDCHTIGDKSKSDSFFIFSFIFVFLFFAFFCLFPPEANHNFLFVLADFALVEN